MADGDSTVNSPSGSGVSSIQADAKILRFTKSVCPDCLAEGEISIVEAVVFEREGKVFIEKNCSTHGRFEEVYWEDSEMYSRAEEFADRGIKILNPNVVSPQKECPTKCGLCEEHQSHTGLANVVVTNRCNLSCWYCFFYAQEGSNIYEPDMETIRKMLRVLKSEQPVGAEAVQFTGGEPTLRSDILDIVKAAREEGFPNILLNTNGIEVYKNQALAHRLKQAARGGHLILYMSFDGVTPRTNPKNYFEVPGVIENARKTDLNMVLVPTVIRGMNEHQVGDILKFGMANNDVVRGVNFQPVSLVGKMPKEEREKNRITIPGVIKKIEEQTGGEINKDDFFPVPSTARLTSFMELLFNTRKYRLSTHFACGMATYIFRDGNRLTTLPRFFDVQGFLEYLSDLEEEIEKSRFRIAGKGMAMAKAFRGVQRFVDEERTPPDLDFKKLLLSSLFKGSYNSLEDINKHSLFIGMMHFQDPYNYDIQRVKKCSVHYALPDGRVIPFCSFNVFPEYYRDKVQDRYSIPHEEWKEKTGKSLKGDKHRRSYSQEEREAIENFYTESLRKVKEL